MNFNRFFENLKKFIQKRPNIEKTAALSKSSIQNKLELILGALAFHREKQGGVRSTLLSEESKLSAGISCISCGKTLRKTIHFDIKGLSPYVSSTLPAEAPLQLILPAGNVKACIQFVVLWHLAALAKLAPFVLVTFIHLHF